MEWKEIQITTAQPGWVARFEQEDGTIDEYPVAVWVIIVNDDGETRVTGFSETLDKMGFDTPDDELSNFVGWRLAKQAVTITDKKTA